MKLDHPGSSSSPFLSGRLTPLRITAIYVIFGLFLLYLSDVLLPSWITDPQFLRQSQAVKGAIEVILTGGVIYFLISRMDRQIQRSQRRYRNLIEDSPAPINLFDADGTTVWGNDAVLELLGLEEREELIGRSIFEFIHPDDSDLAREERDRVIEQEEMVGPTDLRLIRDDGEVRHVRVKTLVGWYQGERIGQAVVNDVTELRTVENELRRERDFIQTALDELRDVFYVISSSGEIERWNSRLSDVTGYDDEELATMEAADFVPPEDEPRVRDAIETALETGDSFIESDLVTKDGDRLQYEFKSARLDEDGESERLVGIGRDITDRKRIEQELRENEQRYRTLVEMSPDPIVVHIDGEIMYVNDAIVDLVDAEEREDVLGESITSFLHPSDHEDAARTAMKTQRGESDPTGYHRRVETLEGRERHIETTSRPIAYEGEPAVLTVINDVTQRHRYEEMLTTLHDRTRAMHRASERETIADIAVKTTDELLDVRVAILYEFIGGDKLVPLAWSNTIGDWCEGSPPARPDEGVVWETFVESEECAVEDLSIDGHVLASAQIVPIRNHGVLVIGSPTGETLTTEQQEIKHLITENVEAAFDRAEREQHLRDQEHRLHRQTEMLEQLNRLNGIIREINQTLIRSSTRAEVMEQVCTQISMADQYSFAWIGVHDPVEGHVIPKHWDGGDSEYVDQLGSADTRSVLHDLVDGAFTENSLRTARNILDDAAWESHRHDALNIGYRSVAAIPIVRGDTVDSVLVIHAKDADLFDKRERLVLEELGYTIGYALRNVERGEAIQMDERTEIDLKIDSSRLITNRISSDLNADIEVVGTIFGDADTLQMFLRLNGVPEDEAQERLQNLETVTAAEPLSVDEETGLYRLTISILPIFRILQQNGVQVREFTAKSGTSHLVGRLPENVNVRSIIEEIQRTYPNTELLARRESTEPIDTRETFRDQVIDRLTGRQREALQTAYYGGFYEWPRETRSEQLADMLDIASSTYQYHLRAAEQTVISSVLESA